MKIINKFIYFLITVSYSLSINNNYNLNEEHHIVAQTALATDEARKIFVNKCKYKLDDKVNVVSIAYRIHKHLHTKVYYATVNKFVSSSYEKGISKGGIGQVKENVYYCVYNINLAKQSFIYVKENKKDVITFIEKY